MTHLGDRVSALVDGQLGIEQTERAHVHLAGCRPCRDAVEAERTLKARLCGLGEPQVSGDLLARLVALGGPAGPLPPRPGHVPGTPRPAPVRVGAADPERAPDRVIAEAALTGAALVGAGAAGPALPSSGGRRLLPRSSRPPGREPATAPGSRRPAGRPAGRVRVVGTRRVRLAGAVLGALGVVGAGVTGLVLVSRSAPSAPAAPVLDSLTVARPAPTSAVLPEDVSLRSPSPSGPSAR